MSRIAWTVASAFFWLAAPAAAAEDICSELRGVLIAAQSEFTNILGPPISGQWPSHLSVFEATLALPGTGPCVIAQQTAAGRRLSTSYTCSNAGRDDDEGLLTLQGNLRQCLDVTEWTIQTDGATAASYGLIRLSITRHGSQGGLALGVEAFRNEQGEIMGSPLRGNRIEANGAPRCSPKTPEEITGFLRMYGTRAGAERFEDRLFVGYTNRMSEPVVAFATRPAHPAHPALIVRRVEERDGAVYVRAGGDFAGDCEAFHALLQEVNEMNRNLRQ